jgi:hypothetical protein
MMDGLSFIVCIVNIRSLVVMMMVCLFKSQMFNQNLIVITIVRRDMHQGI